MRLWYNTRMKALLFTTAAVLSLSPVRADWTIVTVDDPMTDAKKYSIVTKGDPVQLTDFMQYVPELHVRVTPISYDAKTNRMRYSWEVFFAIETEGLRRGESPAKIRFDKNPAEDVTITASTDRRAGFFAPKSKMLDKIAASTNLLVRFSTTLGAVRTVKFPVAGLIPKLKEVKRSVARSTSSPVQNR